MTGRAMQYMGLVAVGCTVAMAAGCGQTKMIATTGRIRQEMVARNYPAALAALRHAKQTKAFKEQDRVMFWMDEGMLLHLLGRYQESTAVLEKAEQRSAELFTKSIRKNIKAAFTSEAATDYPGEDYEKVLMNVIKAFNELSTGNVERALVEARKINEKLAYFNTQYERKNVYNQDAFAHWLAGILFEIEGSFDNSRIAYEKALQLYNTDFAANYGTRPPSYLAEDLVRVVVRNRDTDLLAKYKEQYKADGHTAEALKTHGEVILFHLNGEGPNKSDYFINCIYQNVANWRCDGEPGGEFIKRTTITVTPQGWTALKIALPQLHVHPPANQGITMQIAGVTATSEVAEPISRIAQKVFRDKTARVFKNAIVRAVTKALTQAAAGALGKKAGGGGLGWLASRTASVVNQATEEADKRVWSTLPGRIEVARAWVTPGVHAITLQLPNGQVATIPNVKVEAGRRVFVTFRSMP